jgi:hypothetical protein
MISSHKSTKMESLKVSSPLCGIATLPEASPAPIHSEYKSTSPNKLSEISFL